MRKAKIDRSQINEINQAMIDEDDLVWQPDRQQRIRLILSRTVGAYLMLFFGLGLLMSFFGIDPLTRNGLMPKALFVFVGMAFLIALANAFAEGWSERGPTWSDIKWQSRTQNSGSEIDKWK